MDNFIFKVARSDASLRKSIWPKKNFPWQLTDKIQFVTEAFKKHADFSRLATDNGALDEGWVEREIEFLFKLRNIIAHGGNHLTVHEGDTTTMSFTKLKRDPNGVKDQFEKVTYKITTSQIERAISAKSYLSPLLWSAMQILDGVDVWKETEELQNSREQAKKLKAQLRERGANLDQSILDVEAFLNEW